jgi:wobble nucleotide-excising tRNase
MKKKVFISYSYEDKKFVEWLKDNLQDLGLEIWYDQQEIQLGDSIKHKITLCIQSSSAFIVILSNSSKNSNWMRYELNSALLLNAIKKGIKIIPIKIDDPVSSFDSNFIYHCFSLIKNYFEAAEQLIILTHNFEFFNLIKDWFSQKNRKVESTNKGIMNKAGKKPIPCEFYMIENVIENEKRCASIVPLEETLRKFKSEYHFLFSKLNQFITKGMPDYADFYTIENIARRFLEIYINFKIPTTGDLKSRIDQLDTKTVSKIERDKVYKLIQEFSHGLDPVSTIEHKDKSEIQNAIKVLMKMVEESDKKYFESLKSYL